MEYSESTEKLSLTVFFLLSPLLPFSTLTFSVSSFTCLALSPSHFLFLLFSPSQMSVEGDDKRTRTRSKGIRGECFVTSSHHVGPCLLTVLFSQRAKPKGLIHIQPHSFTWKHQCCCSADCSRSVCGCVWATMCFCVHAYVCLDVCAHIYSVSASVFMCTCEFEHNGDVNNWGMFFIQIGTGKTWRCR